MSLFETIFTPLISQETCTAAGCYIEPGSFITTPFSLLVGITVIAIVLYLDYRADGKIDGGFKNHAKQ